MSFPILFTCLSLPCKLKRILSVRPSTAFFVEFISSYFSLLTLFSCHSLYIYLSIYIYMFVCVCVCVCEYEGCVQYIYCADYLLQSLNRLTSTN
jgi:hypothetical protein